MSTPPPQAGWVRKDDLLRTVSPVGRDYQFSLSPLEGGDPVLQGEFESLTLRPGLVLQRTRVQDLHDMTTRLTLAPGLKIGLLVEGETEIAYGGQPLRLGPRRDALGRLHHSGAVVALAEPDTFTRHWRRGRRESKVSVTLQPEWLDAGALPEGQALDALRAFRACHLARHPWTPSPRALALARQIARPPALAAPFRQWYLEARTLELATEALMAVAGASAAPPVGLAPREHRRLADLLAWIDSQPAAGLTLEAIARQAAMSPTVLQRAFRAAHGQPLFEHLRLRRLEAARLALERDGLSVAQAADIAGYRGAHNFATAFKRRYGCPPRDMRLKA